MNFNASDLRSLKWTVPLTAMVWAFCYWYFVAGDAPLLIRIALFVGAVAMLIAIPLAVLADRKFRRAKEG